MTCIARRSAWLIGFHAVLATAPLAVSLVRMNMETLPLIWIAYSMPIGGLMILALWAGVGNSRVLWRIAALVTGCGYFAIWSTLADWMLTAEQLNPITRYVEVLTPYVVIGTLIGGMFAVMRRWFQIRELTDDEMARNTNRFQFSLFHLLVLMSFVAIVLSLMRGARGTEASDGGIGSWQWWAANGLVVVIFFANTACAAYAALGAVSVTRNCLLVLLASVSLGIAIAFSLRHDQVSPWLFAAGVLTMVLPNIIVMASLLWLRPCGVRLVRRR